MTNLEKSDKLNRLLIDLQDAVDDGVIIVVEGPNDEKALRALGIKGRVEQLSKKPITELAEKLAQECKEVIILTDQDAYGNKAATNLRDSFSNECVKTNLLIRERFKKLLGYTYFEDIATLFENEMNR